MRGTILKIAGIAGIALGASLVAAEPAQAIPTHCDNPPLMVANWARNWCTGGTGIHRVRVLCVGPASGAQYGLYSGWIATNQVNYANCASGFAPSSNPATWWYELTG